MATGQDPLSLSSEKLSDMPDCGWPLSHIWQRGLCCGKHVVMKQAEISRQTLCVPPCASTSCRGCILLVWVPTAGLCGGGVCVWRWGVGPQSTILLRDSLAVTMLRSRAELAALALIDSNPNECHQKRRNRRGQTTTSGQL